MKKLKISKETALTVLVMLQSAIDFGEKNKQLLPADVIKAHSELGEVLNLRRKEEQGL